MAVRCGQKETEMERRRQQKKLDASNYFPLYNTRLVPSQMADFDIGNLSTESLFGRNNQSLVERPSIVRHRKRQPLEIEKFSICKARQDHSELDRYSTWSNWWPFMTNKLNLDLAKRNHAVGQRLC